MNEFWRSPNVYELDVPITYSYTISFIITDKRTLFSNNWMKWTFFNRRKSTTIIEKKKIIQLDWSSYKTIKNWVDIKCMKLWNERDIKLKIDLSNNNDYKIWATIHTTHNVMWKRSTDNQTEHWSYHVQRVVAFFFFFFLNFFFFSSIVFCSWKISEFDRIRKK